jgi:hypothetical protein
MKQCCIPQQSKTENAPRRLQSAMVAVPMVRDRLVLRTKQGDDVPAITLRRSPIQKASRTCSYSYR